MAYAIRNPAVGGVVSIAGNDLGEFASRLRSSPSTVAGLRRNLVQMRAPDPDALIAEILNGESRCGHVESAAQLAKVPVLLVGGWHDRTAPIETVVLPVYRALKSPSGSDVTILACQDGHAFLRSREKLASDMAVWLAQRFPR
jgi:pimeloyl-ACP methyl ester carboxylesterase